MSKRGRRIAAIIGLTGAALVVGVAALAGSVALGFAGLTPARDGQSLPGGAQLVRDGFANLYILPEGGGRVALIDCGNDAAATSLTAALKAKGLGLDAVDAVFITHGHPDHIGGCKALPRARLYAMAREAGAIEGREAIPGLLSGKPHPTGLKVAEGLADGRSIRAGDLSITAFALPGHTPGSAAYLANGVIYVGDTAEVTKRGGFSGGAWIFNTDAAQARASLRRLAERLAAHPPAMIATGHSGPGAGAMLSQARAD